jgi:hypothetical protein
MPDWMASSIFSVKQFSTLKLTFQTPFAPFTLTSLMEALWQNPEKGNRQIKRKATPPTHQCFLIPYFIKVIEGL